MSSAYAQSIGVTDADAHTARNIRLSVADCKHLTHVLLQWIDEQQYAENIPGVEWTEQLVEYFRTAV